MEFIYQINIVHKSTHYRAVTNIIEADNKQEVLKYLENTYPEYFLGNKVAQRLSNKSEQTVFVTIFELNEYWKKYWEQDIKCVVCGKSFKLIDINNQLGVSMSNNFTCSQSCQNKLKLIEQQKNEDYWNTKSQYYYIYKITNKFNNKVYIGYTEREVIFRWWEHLTHSNKPLGNALKFYGIEKFTFEVLERHLKHEKTIEDIKRLETEYIKKYDSINNGYNCIVSKK